MLYINSNVHTFVKSDIATQMYMLLEERKTVINIMEGEVVILL